MGFPAEDRKVLSQGGSVGPGWSDHVRSRDSGSVNRRHEKSQVRSWATPLANIACPAAICARLRRSVSN